MQETSVSTCDCGGGEIGTGRFVVAEAAESVRRRMEMCCLQSSLSSSSSFIPSLYSSPSNSLSQPFAIMPGWSRLITFIAVEDNSVHHGEPVDSNLDIGLAYASGQTIKARILPAGVSPLDSNATPTSTERTVRVLLPPLDQQHIPSIRALGANFVQSGQDAKEAKSKRPVLPILFYKPLTALSGPERDIVIPKAATRNGDETDWEVELVSTRRGSTDTKRSTAELTPACLSS